MKVVAETARYFSGGVGQRLMATKKHSSACYQLESIQTKLTYAQHPFCRIAIGSSSQGTFVHTSVSRSLHFNLPSKAQLFFKYWISPQVRRFAYRIMLGIMIALRLSSGRWLGLHRVATASWMP